MKRLVSAIVVAALVAGCAHGGGLRTVGSAPSAPGAGLWDSVKALRAGSSLEVTLFTRELIVGTLVAADDNRVFMLSDQARVEVIRSDIREVGLVQGVTRGTRAKRGFLVGAAIGIAVATLTVETNQAPWTVMLAGGWGSLGAGLGALAGSTRTLRVIYQGPAPVRGPRGALGKVGPVIAGTAYNWRSR